MKIKYFRVLWQVKLINHQKVMNERQLARFIKRGVYDNLVATMLNAPEFQNE